MIHSILEGKRRKEGTGPLLSEASDVLTDLNPRPVMYQNDVHA